ncbi:MAG TPA: hypothetical protein VFQ51_12445 [Vicinamibacteria bacterium]|nr:hypothetical protein [Vicinamibacteria bacterium]
MRAGSARRPLTIALALCLCALAGPAAWAEPVKVRVAEGPLYSVLVLKSVAGAVLAHGEILQTLRRGLVESRLTFRFRDSSLFDETVTFSQQGVFALTSYRLVQRGPSFPGAAEVTFERASGQYRARIQEAPDKAPEVLTGRLELPADVYNGMTSTLLKSLPAKEIAHAHLLAFTPKPRVLTLTLTPDREDAFAVGPVTRKAIRYHVKPELGGMLGVVAAVIGKEPPDLYYWIASGPAPAFMKFEGPFYVNGPVWRIEPGGPRWLPPR